MAGDGILLGVRVAVTDRLIQTIELLVLVDRCAAQNGVVLFGFIVVQILAKGLAQQISNLAGLELVDCLLLSLTLHIGTIDTAGGVYTVAPMQIVAITDRTVFDIASHTTTIACNAVERAGVVATYNASVENIAHHAADIHAAATRAVGDLAGIIAVADGAAGNIARHATDIPNAINHAGIITVADCARVRTAHHTAYLRQANDFTSVVAVTDGSFINTCHTTDIHLTVEIGIHDADIQNLALGGNIAEKADIILQVVIEVQTGDGLVIALKGTSVVVIEIADGGPGTAGSTVRTQDILVDHDVIHQLAVDGSTAAVDLLGKPVELACVVDLVVAVHQLGLLISVADGAEAFVEAVAGDSVLLSVGVADGVGFSGTGLALVLVDRCIAQNGVVLFGFAVVDVLTEGLAQQISNLTGCEFFLSLGDGFAISVANAPVCCAGQIVAVCDGAIGDIAHHAADILIAADGTSVVAVDDADLQEKIARHAADILIAADAARVVAVDDTTVAAKRSRHAADVIVTADAAHVVAVDDTTTAGNTSRHAADILIAAEVGIQEAQVLDLAAVDIAEETDIVLCCVVEVQTGDGLSVAVKGAGIIHALAVTDGCPGTEIRAITVQGAVLVQDILVDLDVIHQLAVDGFTAAVDLLGKPVELACVVDLVVAVHQLGLLINIAAAGAEALDKTAGVGFFSVVSPDDGSVVAEGCLVDGAAGEGRQTGAAGLEPPLTGGLTAIEPVCDLTGGKPLRRNRSLTAGNLVASLGADYTGCVSVAVGHRAGTVRSVDIAAGIGYQIAAAVVGLDGHILCVAVGNGAAVITGRDTAHNILAGVDGRIHHIAVGDRTARKHLTHNTASTEILCPGGEGITHAGQAKIFHGTGDGAEQAIGLLHRGGGGHLQVGNHLAVTVEGTGVAGVGVIVGSGFVVQAGLGDGRPVVAAHVDISGELAVDILAAAVYFLHKPDQLGLVGNLVDAASQAGLSNGLSAGIAEAVTIAICMILPDGVKRDLSFVELILTAILIIRLGRVLILGPAQESTLAAMGQIWMMPQLCQSIFNLNRAGARVEAYGVHVLKTIGTGQTAATIGIITNQTGKRESIHRIEHLARLCQRYLDVAVTVFSTCNLIVITPSNHKPSYIIIEKVIRNLYSTGKGVIRIQEVFGLGDADTTIFSEIIENNLDSSRIGPIVQINVIAACRRIQIRNFSIREAGGRIAGRRRAAGVNGQCSQRRTIILISCDIGIDGSITSIIIQIHLSVAGVRLGGAAKNIESGTVIGNTVRRT